VIREIWLVFVRAVLPTLHKPSVIVVGISQPLLYLVLFGPLLTGVSAGARSSWQWYVPGIMVQLALFGTAYAGFNLLPELRSGALERMRVTPVSRVALLVGRVLRDVVLLVVQAALLVVVALLFGFRAGIGPLLLGLALLAVLGIAIGAASYTLALRLRQEYAFAPVLGMTVLPAMLLSGVLLPMNLAPRWLYDLSRINPLSHVVDGERAIVAANWGATAVWLGPLLAVALLVVCVTWGARTFRQDNG
jgi:ABC-2 type transport system permease protein